MGNDGSVQGILGAVTVQNPPSFTTLNVNDSADTTARTVALGTSVSGGSNWGSITGLAPAAINFKYADTSGVNVTTGSGNDTVNVFGTGVPTSLSTSGGNDTINLGNGGSVQPLFGALSIQNPHGSDTIKIDDSARHRGTDRDAEHVVSGGVNSGAIIGLAPAAINYKYAGTSSVSIITGSGNDTINVQGTGVATSLSSELRDATRSTWATPAASRASSAP